MTTPSRTAHARSAARLAGPLVLLLGLVAGLLVGTAPTASAARAWPGHPGRHLVAHVVRHGETPSGIAVRYHAWTRELIALNGATLYAGRRILVPVVDAAARAARHPRHASKHAPKHAPKHHAVHHAKHPRHHAGRTTRTHRRLAARGWRAWAMPRQRVRSLVARTAQRHGVPHTLALAIAWQESGWQQLRVSPAGALGVMQVLPGTARWMSGYAKRPLNPRDTADNVTAGVTLISLLRHQAHGKRRAIGAYYQGLGAVQRHGLYRETRAYVARVLAIERRLRHGHRLG